jgi:putative YphP/YqiW family bacilliredoxin
MYPAEMVAPYAKDLTDYGFKGLTTPSEVEEVVNTQGTVLVVVNSVCGCAAANCRPAAKLSIQGEKKPDVLATVFAGFDVEAVNKAREMMLPYPPSSPSIALFKDGKLVHMVERREIEGRTAQMIAENLVGAYNTHC